MDTRRRRRRKRKRKNKKDKWINELNARVCENVFFSTLIFFPLVFTINAFFWYFSLFSPLFLSLTHSLTHSLCFQYHRYLSLWLSREMKKSTTGNCSQQSRILCEGVACKQLYARIIAAENDSNKQGHSMAVTWIKKRGEKQKISQGRTREATVSTRKNTEMRGMPALHESFYLYSLLFSSWRRQNDRQLFFSHESHVFMCHIDSGDTFRSSHPPTLPLPLPLLLHPPLLFISLLVIFIITGTTIYSLSLNNIYSLFHREK